jgi:hypothetical protein
MALAIWFWIIMFLWLVGGLINGWPAATSPPGRLPYWSIGGGLILWILLALLGWQAFGAPVKG